LVFDDDFAALNAVAADDVRAVHIGPANADGAKEHIRVMLAEEGEQSRAMVIVLERKCASKLAAMLKHLLQLDEAELAGPF